MEVEGRRVRGPDPHRREPPRSRWRDRRERPAAVPAHNVYEAWLFFGDGVARESGSAWGHELVPERGDMTSCVARIPDPDARTNSMNNGPTVTRVAPTRQLSVLQRDTPDMHAHDDTK